MKVKKNNILFAMILFAVVLLGGSVTVKADKYVLLPKADVHAGTLKSAGVWTNVKKTSSKSVTNDLDPNSKTGYYYFGVKAHARDFRVTTKTEKYKKEKGSYKWVSSTSRANGNAALYSNPLYYKWYKS